MPQLSDYLNRLASEHKGKPKLAATLSLFVQPFIDNQNLWAAMPGIIDLDSAAGVFLDYCGAWVGIARGSLTDDVYRTLIKAQIAIDHWDGTVPGMYSIWDTVFGGDIAVLVQDNQDMSMFVVFTKLSFNAAEIALLLAGQFDLRPAGVQWLGYFKATGTPVFAFDVENANMAGFDVGYCPEAITS